MRRPTDYCRLLNNLKLPRYWFFSPYPDACRPEYWDPTDPSRSGKLLLLEELAKEVDGIISPTDLANLACGRYTQIVYQDNDGRIGYENGLPQGPEWFVLAFFLQELSNQRKMKRARAGRDEEPDKFLLDFFGELHHLFDQSLASNDRDLTRWAINARVMEAILTSFPDSLVELVPYLPDSSYVKILSMLRHYGPIHKIPIEPQKLEDARTKSLNADQDVLAARATVSQYLAGIGLDFLLAFGIRNYPLVARVGKVLVGTGERGETRIIEIKDVKGEPHKVTLHRKAIPYLRCVIMNDDPRLSPLFVAQIEPSAFESLLRLGAVRISPEDCAYALMLPNISGGGVFGQSIAYSVLYEYLNKQSADFIKQVFNFLKGLMRQNDVLKGEMIWPKPVRDFLKRLVSFRGDEDKGEGDNLSKVALEFFISVIETMSNWTLGVLSADTKKSSEAIIKLTKSAASNLTANLQFLSEVPNLSTDVMQRLVTITQSIIDKTIMLLQQYSIFQYNTLGGDTVAADLRITRARIELLATQVVPALINFWRIKEDDMLTSIRVIAGDDLHTLHDKLLSIVRTDQGHLDGANHQVLVRVVSN